MRRSYPLLRLLLHLQRLKRLPIILISNQALKPLILHLELLDLALKIGDFIGHLLGLLLESLLTLLLLYAEAGGGGGIATTLIFFGGEAGLLF